MLGIGLLLAVDGVITPLWLVFSHEHPLTSDVIGECCSETTLNKALLLISNHLKISHCLSKEPILTY